MDLVRQAESALTTLSQFSPEDVLWVTKMLKQKAKKEGFEDRFETLTDILRDKEKEAENNEETK